MKKWLAPVVMVFMAFSMTTGVTVTSAEADVVKTRIALMKELSGHNKKIRAYIKGHKSLKREKRLGNHEDIEFIAIAIQDLAKRMHVHYKKGTSLKDVKGTRAKAEIWQNWSKFRASARNLGAWAKDIENAAKTGSKAKIMAAYNGFGKATCGGCHKNFRGPKPKKKK